MKHSNNELVNKCVNYALATGCKLTRGKKHPMLILHNNKKLIFARTPSCYRSGIKLKCTLKRHYAEMGLDFDLR